MFRIRRLFINLSFYRFINCSAYLNTGEYSPKTNLKILLDNSASFEQRNPESDKWVTPVYPVKQRKQGLEILRPDVDPRTTSVILFPGQVIHIENSPRTLLMPQY